MSDNHYSGHMRGRREPRLSLSLGRDSGYPFPEAETEGASQPRAGHHPEAASWRGTPACRMPRPPFAPRTMPRPVQIIFGLQDSDDPALPVAKSLKEKFPELDIGITVDGASHGANAKISNLINMNATAKHDILIAVGQRYSCAAGLSGAGGGSVAKARSWRRQRPLLRRIGRAGLVAVRGAVASTRTSCRMSWWGRRSAWRSPASARPSRSGAKCWSGLAALRLSRISLPTTMQSGQRCERQGFSVEIGPSTVGHVCHEESFRDLLRHQLRWARTIRSIDLPGYLGSFIAHPFGLAFLGAAAEVRLVSRWPFWLSACALACARPWSDPLSFGVKTIGCCRSRI